MAAFSSQYYPFLVDSSFLPNITSFPAPSYEFHSEETSFNLTNQRTQTSCVDKSSKITTISDNSPQSSMVVDKLETGEQVTQKVVVEKKRRARNGSSLTNLQSKDATEERNKKQMKSNGGVKEEDRPKVEKKDQGKGNKETPAGYIHVRARRGQATDSHSLAERVRREKISERMKMLQRLVPGCNKVTGKALMLDEIINYVQSLQNQVEFLSMKLASVNPMFYDLTTDLDNLLARPEKINSITSVAQCSSPKQATTFADTTTVTPATIFPTANNDYLVDGSASIFLQEQRPNIFSEDTDSHFCDAEDQQHKFLHPFGFSNNLCSFH